MILAYGKRIGVVMIAVGVALCTPHLAFASDGNITQIEDFIRSIIKVLASIAGLVAAGFFVFGGFAYMTSSGNPEHLDRAKRTLLYSAVGLAITLGAFVLSSIVTDLATSSFGK